jgi:hypothetical protein
MRLRLRSVLPWLLLLVSTVILAASGYRLLRRIPLAGEGGWDYLTFDPVPGGSILRAPATSSCSTPPAARW